METKSMEERLGKLEEKLARLKELGETLKSNEIPAAERQKILSAELRKWEEQRKAARKKIAALDRKNATRFDQVAGQMFTRLAHEVLGLRVENRGNETVISR